MTVTHPHRLVCWFERAVLCLSLLYLCMHTLPRAWRTLNTDFPNYYLSARLAHEGYDTSRMYEWPWIEREKDHRNIDNRVIGAVADYAVLDSGSVAADRAFTTCCEAYLDTSEPGLSDLNPLDAADDDWSQLSENRAGFLAQFSAASNLLYGQFYVLLLLLIVAACWSYLRGLRMLAGALVALARSLQSISSSVLRLLPAAPRLARDSFRSSYGNRCSCHVYRYLWR